jgi:Tfp pilus assembly major pilin PilA
MSTFRSRQRGEGKVGCISSAVILAILAAAAIKIVPVYYANNQLVDAATRRAEAASGRDPEVMTKELLAEARTIGVEEALRPRAISITKKAGTDSNMGSCTVRLNYSTTVDFYGVYKYDVIVDKTITKPLLENIR